MNKDLSSGLPAIKNPCFRSVLQNTLSPCMTKGKIAILFTGGIDSTALACLARKASPVLYFAEILDPSCAVYNKHSIRHCRNIARRLGLRFHAVPVNLKTFQTHSALLWSRDRKPGRDQYLPAADHLFSLMKEQAKTTVLSGMGADEILGSPLRQLRELLLNKEPPSLQQHRQAAQKYGLTFLAPFMNIAFVSRAMNVSFEYRRFKKPLIRILQTTPGLWPMMKDRPRQDSFIPETFFGTASATNHTPEIIQTQ